MNNILHIICGLTTAGLFCGIGWLVLAPDSTKIRRGPVIEAVQLAGFVEAGVEETERVGMTGEELSRFEDRWRNAPREIVALALQIARGRIPEANALHEIGRDGLSRGYPAPRLDFTVNDRPVVFMTTLLQEAVLAYNFEAAQALLAAGADPDENHGEALFLAVTQKTRGAPPFMMFPDFDAMLPFLRACLKAGANPNVQRYGFLPRTPFGEARLENNLGAMLILLQSGADPWKQYPGPSGRLRDSALESLAFSAGSNASAEILFRLAHSGYMPRGTQQQQDRVFALLSAAAEKFASSNDAKSRHTAWRLDQVSQALGDALSRESHADALRANLVEFNYEKDGGWYLAADEVHSRYDAPISAPATGTQIWEP